MIRKFISQIDGAEILCRWNSEYENLEIKLDGCDWSDFNIEDKRAYSKEQYRELMLFCKMTLLKKTNFKAI